MNSNSRATLLAVSKPSKHVQLVSEDDIKLLLQEFAARGVISKYGVPGRIIFVDALPKASVGKIDKKVLRQQYAG